MTLQDWFNESRERIAQHGIVTGGRGSAEALLTGVLDRTGRAGFNYGTSIFEREWDVLVILDTCRPDLLKQVSSEYEYVPEEVPTHTSLGSASVEWIRKNFTDGDYSEPFIDRSTNGWYGEELANTAYVTSNLFAEHIDDDDLLYLDEVHEYGWNEEVCTTPPEVVTDRAVAAAREHDPDRLIVHYMQPHAPYRSMIDRYGWDEKPGVGNYGATHPAREMWEELRANEISIKEVWDAYRDNLRWVLDDGVTPLLNNVDADRVILSSDHGEAFGRWGAETWTADAATAREWGTYAHPPYVPLKTLKEVPWVETTATDTGELTPSVTTEEEAVSEDERKDRLEALGYV
ncbi:hypothetical protein SY89_01418 [Halolamina pelagica]|uniref:Sulfatase n=1 Tax=Halolamina pelagica TaxID=699431 RepID=A0A0P7I1P9_9EURY|nr:hypothetical protein [Halolamina pelagica]KPN30682.1 hypothetical protein SY89_01418 [Halolamina pelagica]